MVHDDYGCFKDHMGNTGEIIANECNISREKMDSFMLGHNILLHMRNKVVI